MAGLTKMIAHKARFGKAKELKKRGKKGLPDKEVITWGKNAEGKVTLHFSFSGTKLVADDAEDAYEKIRAHRKNNQLFKNQSPTKRRVDKSL